MTQRTLDRRPPIEVRSRLAARVPSGVSDRLRGWGRRARAEVADRLGRHRRERQRLDTRHAAILMYHRVLPAAEARARAVEPGMYVTPETFARHLDWLVEAFQVVPLHEIVTRLSVGAPLRERSVAITFDDGWRDNHDHALPLLSERALPATVFVVTDRIGSTGAFWTDELARRLAPLSTAVQAAIVEELEVPPSPGAPLARALDALKRLDMEALDRAMERLRECTGPVSIDERELLDWEEIDRMAEAGVAIESHGCSHAILTGLPDDTVQREVEGALGTLRARGYAEHGLFAYPSGAYDARALTAVQRAGYAAAVTVEPGLAEPDRPPFELPRIALHDDVSGSRAEFMRRVPGPHHTGTH